MGMSEVEITVELCLKQRSSMPRVAILPRVSCVDRLGWLVPVVGARGTNSC